jgi:glycosyltransferase involved in cell wall biosynthesis
MLLSVPPTRTTLRDGFNARLVVPGNADHLAAAINELLDDAPLRHTLGNQAWADVRDTFTQERELAANLEVYSEAYTMVQGQGQGSIHNPRTT